MNIDLGNHPVIAVGIAIIFVVTVAVLWTHGIAKTRYDEFIGDDFP